MTKNKPPEFKMPLTDAAILDLFWGAGQSKDSIATTMSGKPNGKLFKQALMIVESAVLQSWGGMSEDEVRRK